MKVKVISDSHNKHDQLQDLECDILVHCGDACNKGSYTEAKNFLEWFVKQPAKYKIYVRGNHDAGFKKSNDLFAKAAEYGIIILNNSSVTINDRLIWGCSFVSSIRLGVYARPLSDREKAWEDMPDEVDLLITHVPPLGILDSNVRNENIGDDQLLANVMTRNIKKHVFGHVHNHGGKTIQVYDTEFYNCACVSDNHVVERNYTEIDI